MHDGQRRSLKIRTASPDRFSLLERLAEIRRRASALIVREITEERRAPPRVWFVREAALADMATRIRTPAGEWRPHSELVRGVGRRRSRGYSCGFVALLLINVFANLNIYTNYRTRIFIIENA